MHNTGSIQAIVFDYGNTLIPFGKAEIERLDQALCTCLESIYGHVDAARVSAIRHRNRVAPYEGDPPAYRENDLAEITVSLVRDLYGREATAIEMEQILRVRYESFLGVVRAPDRVRVVLEQLAGKRRLALLSNYPSGKAIRDSLDQVGLAPFFESVVVSGDIGYVKPHALPFRTVLDALRLQPGQVLYVGDNWLADVQGARRHGWRVVHTLEWGGAPEGFDRSPGDLEPDAVIHRLDELIALL